MYLVVSEIIPDCFSLTLEKLAYLFIISRFYKSSFCIFKTLWHFIIIVKQNFRNLDLSVLESAVLRNHYNFPSYWRRRVVGGRNITMLIWGHGNQPAHFLITVCSFLGSISFINWEVDKHVLIFNFVVLCFWCLLDVCWTWGSQANIA